MPDGEHKGGRRKPAPLPQKSARKTQLPPPTQVSAVFGVQMSRPV